MSEGYKLDEMINCTLLHPLIERSLQEHSMYNTEVSVHEVHFVAKTVLHHLPDELRNFISFRDISDYLIHFQTQLHIKVARNSNIGVVCLPVKESESACMFSSLAPCAMKACAS